MSNLKILFIDDEENVLSALRRSLRAEFPEAEFTTDPDEVLRRVREERIALVVSDQRMPRLEGVELLRLVQEASPRTVRMMLTGYADIKSAMRAVNEGNVFRFLAKPWAEAELRNAIEAGLAQYQLVEENARLQKLTQHQNQELLQFNQDLEQMVETRTEEIRGLNVELKAAFFSAIKTTGSIAGILDPRLEGHTLRVARLAGLLGRDLGLGEAELFDLQAAAYLHDVGSLRRSFSERGAAPSRDEVRRSARVIALIPGLGDGAAFVRHQGERYDGKGFPDGLARSAIPLGARILAVASEFHRHLHLGGLERPTPLNALEAIRTAVDSIFDPQVVAALGRYVERNLPELEKDFEQGLRLLDLRPGMVVSRPILSVRGEVLVAKDYQLNPDVLDGLWQRQLNEYNVGSIYVYKYSLDGQAVAA